MSSPATFVRLACSLDSLTIRTATVVLLALVVGLPASAATFLVSDISDGLPAPPGSLREAIELSEENGEADEILFIIDGGTIELVAPLPDLDEGRLRIGEPQPSGAPAVDNGITISGRANLVSRAIAIRSGGNVISELNFAGFTGTEVILIQGDAARDNVISGCVFGLDNASAANAGAALHIRSSGSGTGGTPRGTDIRFSRFIRNDVGVLINGDAASIAQRPWTVVRDNSFGTDAFGGPGPGNGEAIRATDGGRIFIWNNRFSGPGLGITLGTGSDLSLVSGNTVGLRGDDGTPCSGFTGPAVLVSGSSQVRIRDNAIFCSDVGIRLEASADGAELRNNRIGAESPDGQRSHGIVIDDSRETFVRRNVIAGNEGYGVTTGPGPVVDPTPGAVLACNSIWNNTLGALNLPDVATLPPILTATTPLAVFGELPDLIPGWVEIFGDDDEQSRLFQGAVRGANLDPPFRHRLPVLGLRASAGSSGFELTFDTEVPANHTATLTGETTRETTELSDGFPSESAGLVYDVIRGRLSNLVISGTGGIDLGPVVCLEEGLDPSVVVTPGVPDPDVPAPGEGFFYLVRRKNQLADERGTYDPAVCLTDIDDFVGGRSASSGDCH